MIRRDPRAKVALPHDALDLPDGLDTSNIKDWCSYGIWGLLLYDEQSPWLTLIECMHILFYRHQTKDRRLFEPLAKDAQGLPKHEAVTYYVPRNWKLRYMLFRDLDTSEIAARGSPVGEAQWRELTHRINEGASSLNVTFNDLQIAFEDVESLNKALDVLRSTEVEAVSNKRWTSRHLLPLGPDMLFADISAHDFKADRRFVRRSGELLYLMLGRASDKKRDKLEELLKIRLFDRDTPWNELARLIRGREIGRESAGEDSVELKTGYLPIRTMDVYDNLAEDWVALLKLRTKPIEDLLDPLMRLSTIHQVIYILQRTKPPLRKAHRTRSHPSCSKWEGPGERTLFETSAHRQHENHRLLPKHAIDAFINTFANSVHWTDGLGASMEAANAVKTLKDMFLWEKRSGGVAGVGPDANAILKSYGESAREDSKHTIWASLVNRTKGVGITQARTRAGTWYAPNDAVLEALVLANVRGPLEVREFVRRLYERYRIVIGQEQAQWAFGTSASVSLEQLKVNEQRLEHRLRTLGFVDRKSDACAFVVNPFHEDDDEPATEAA